MRFIFWDSRCVGRSCYFSFGYLRNPCRPRSDKTVSWLFQLLCCIASVWWYIVTCYLQRRKKIHVHHKTCTWDKNVPEFISCWSIWEQRDRDEIIISYYTCVSVFACARARVCYTHFIEVYNVIHIWYILPQPFSDAFAKLRKATVTFIVSVRSSAWNILACTGQIFIKFDIWIFLES